MKKLRAIEVREYLLSFCAEYSVFQFLIRNVRIKVYRSVILPAVLYGCETCLRGERKLRVSENRVLRRIIGPKREEITYERRKLHNEELNDLY